MLKNNPASYMGVLFTMAMQNIREILEVQQISYYFRGSLNLFTPSTYHATGNV